MARKIKSIDEAPVDVVEAIKRSFIHRGFIPRKYRRNSPLSDDSWPAPVKSEPAKNPDVELIDSEAGSQEASKDPDEPEPGETHEKLIDITEKAHDVLFEADTVFPFTLFPDTLTIDREKLTIASRSFFRVAQIVTVPITSMVSAEANVGPFFGSLHMTSKYFQHNTYSVNFLWRKDAEEAHRLLQGYIIAQEREIDVSDVEKEDLIILLNDLGQGVAS